MITIITGLSGSGKTNVSYSLMFSGFFSNAVFIESEWFSAKVPFDWANKVDIESLFQATGALIDFNVNRGVENFIVTLGMPQLKYYNEFIKYIAKDSPITLICLTCEKDEVVRRVHERGRHEKQRQLELDAVNGDYESMKDFIHENNFAFEIDTTKMDEAQVTTQIIEILKKHGERLD